MTEGCTNPPVARPYRSTGSMTPRGGFGGGTYTFFTGPLAFLSFFDCFGPVDVLLEGSGSGSFDFPALTACFLRVALEAEEVALFGISTSVRNNKHWIQYLHKTVDESQMFVYFCHHFLNRSKDFSRTASAEALSYCSERSFCQSLRSIVKDLTPWAEDRVLSKFLNSVGLIVWSVDVEF